MRKSFLGFAATALALVSLAACGGSNPPAPPAGGDIPVEEGKVTFHFEKDPSSVAFETYESVYLVGSLTNWATGADSLPYAFTQLEGTDTFYVQIPVEQAGETGEYKMLLGYNETSEYPPAECGLLWKNEANGYPDDSWVAGGGNSAYTVTGDTVDLGTYKWSKHLPAPTLVTYTDFDLDMHFHAPVPEGHHVYIMGAFNGWASPMEMTADDEATRTEYSYHVTTELYAGDYEFKVIVHPDATTVEGFNVWAGGFEVVGGANSVFTANDIIEVNGAKGLYGNEKFYPCNQVGHVYDLEDGTQVTVTGIYTGKYLASSKAGMFVQDRDRAILVYGTTTLPEGLEVGKTVTVAGELDIYNGLYEVKNATWTVHAESRNQVVADPIVNPNLANTTKYDQGRLATVTGVVKSNAVKVDANGSIVVTVTPAEGDAYDVTVYVHKSNDAAAQRDVLAAAVVGDTVTVKAYVGCFNAPQLVAIQEATVTPATAA